MSTKVLSLPVSFCRPDTLCQRLRFVSRFWRYVNVCVSLCTYVWCGAVRRFGVVTVFGVSTKFSTSGTVSAGMDECLYAHSYEICYRPIAVLAWKQSSYILVHDRTRQAEIRRSSPNQPQQQYRREATRDAIMNTSDTIIDESVTRTDVQSPNGRPSGRIQPSY